MTSYERWLKLMQALCLSENERVYQLLFSAYSEKHRFYHTLTHINSCLDQLGFVNSSAEHPKEVELAIWFHDAVYKPFSSKNELKSANWAVEFIEKNSVDDDIIQRVHNLIMTTVHNIKTKTLDESIIVDIDLSILGSEPETYKQFEIDVRKEYKRVPYSIYSKKRKQILLDFLSRRRIYQNSYFIEQCERKARVNLENAISLL